MKIRIKPPAVFVCTAVLTTVLALGACTGQTPDTGSTSADQATTRPQDHYKKVEEHILMEDKPGIIAQQQGPVGDEQAPVSAAAVPADLLERMRADVANQSGLEADRIVIVRAEGVTWRDSSLGCPQPNMGYTHALVEGYWVILRANREEYDFRATTHGSYTRCTGQTRQAPIRYDDAS